MFCNSNVFNHVKMYVAGTISLVLFITFRLYRFIFLRMAGPRRNAVRIYVYIRTRLNVFAALGCAALDTSDVRLINASRLYSHMHTQQNRY